MFCAIYNMLTYSEYSYWEICPASFQSLEFYLIFGYVSKESTSRLNQEETSFVF